MTIIDDTPLDAAKLEQFVFRAVEEVGATLNAALVVIGDGSASTARWPAPARSPPRELAERTGTAERYVREWLDAQAAGGYVTYDASERYTLPPEQAIAFCDEGSPAYLPGLFQKRSARCWTRRGSPTPPAPAPASAGTSTTCTSTTAPSASSARATSPTWSRPGCPRSTASSQSSSAARASPTSAAATAPRRSSWPRRSPTRVLRLRLPRGFDRDRAPARRGGRRRRPRALRGRARRRLHRRGLRSRGDVRLPARHGRPRRRGPARARHARARRHLDDRRALRRRPRRGQPQPGRPRLLRLLDAALHARLALPGRRPRARRAGRARRACAKSSPRRGFTRFRRATETPFNLVLEARP